MIAGIKDLAKRHWPRLRLRTILFATLFVVAALPGFGAVFLRVYENTLVRQTEAELVAQGAALAAAAAADWPGATPGVPLYPSRIVVPGDGVDLSQTPILPERPAPAAAPAPAPDAAAALHRLAPILRATQMTTLASILLLDRDGRLVPGGGGLARLPEVAAALHGRPTTVLRRNGAYRAVYRFEWLSRAAAIRIHHARPIVVNGRVVGVLLMSRTARALFRGLYEDRGKIAIGIAAIFGLLIVISGIISRGVTRPIERLGQATRAVASGRGRVPEVPPTAAIEIQGLYADFAAMTAAIEHRSRYLRDFAYAVSHEFKTPLAGIRGAIELLHDHPDMAAADRTRFLANVDADAQRLTSLTTRLLDLARADMTAPGESCTDPAAVIARAADAVRGPGFTVEVTPGPMPPVALPATTIETTLATLFDNARQAGARAVRIDACVLAPQLVLTIGDDGPGIAPADAARLFEPFFTTRRGQGGTGLGLPIAVSLLEAGGGTLTLETAHPTTFRVTLPLA